MLREREAEGDTVLVLSDFLLVSVRPLQSPRWLPMGVPQFTVSLPTSPVKGCATRLACLLLHRQRPPLASGVLIPAVNTHVTQPGIELARSRGAMGGVYSASLPHPSLGLATLPGILGPSWQAGSGPSRLHSVQRKFF